MTGELQFCQFARRFKERGNWTQRKTPRTEEPLILRPRTRILRALLGYLGGTQSTERHERPEEETEICITRAR
jgi:hypothetical protein